MAIDLSKEEPILLRDLAAKLGVSMQGVKQWTIRGVGGKKLEAVRIGRKWYTTMGAVQSFSAQTVEPITSKTKSNLPHLRSKTDRSACGVASPTLGPVSGPSSCGCGVECD